MRKILIFISAALVLQFASCGNAKQDDQALLMAEGYYDSLVAGNYDFFMRGTYLPDTIPTSYREQLETNLKMFMARQEAEHKGIKAIAALRCTHDTLKGKDGTGDIHTANAFLELTFGDSLKEEIVVPMIESNKVWLMR